ncbi:MAG TPA: hypothetical protein VJA16_16725 [Thermoanaerobaculia bacterium]
MPREALAAVLLQLPRLSERLHLAPGEALEVVADDAQLVHLEHRLAGGVQQALTPPMAPERLLALVDGMGLALDLDRHLTPSRSLFRPQPPPAQSAGPAQSQGPAPTAGHHGRRPPESH